MKPVAFDYERPVTLADAATLLGQSNGFAKILAGGQSLGAMLNLRLAQPDLLVDITSIPELTAVTDAGDHLEIGACVPHADIEDGRVADHFAGLLRQVAGRIAYRPVRNRGTIGGSIAHADPAAELPLVLTALGGSVTARSHRGERRIEASGCPCASNGISSNSAAPIPCAVPPKIWPSTIIGLIRTPASSTTT